MAYIPKFEDVADLMPKEKPHYVPKFEDVADLMPGYKKPEAPLAPYGESDLGAGLSGVANIGRSFYNELLSRPATTINRWLTGAQKHVLGKDVLGLQDVPELPIELPETTAGKVGRFAGQAGADIAMLGPLDVAGIPAVAEQVASQLPRSLGALTRAGSVGAKQAAIGGAQSAIESPDDPEGAFKSGAVFGGVLGGLTPGLRGAPKLLGKALGEQSPGHAKRISEAMGRDINIPLGDITGSGALRSINQLAEKVPLSGIGGMYKKAAEGLSERYKSILGNMAKGGSPEAFSENLRGSLQKAYDSVHKIKREKYALRDRAAEKVDQVINPENYVNLAKEHLDQIQSDLAASPELAHLSTDGKLTKFLKGIVDNPGDKPFKNVTSLDSMLNEAGHKAHIDNNRYESMIYGGLKNALRTDLDSAVQKSGNQKLVDLWKEANEHYAKEVAPFDDRDIMRFIKRGGDPDQITQTFVKTGAYARPNQLKKILDKLPDSSRRMMAVQHLTRGLRETDALGNIYHNPARLKTAYEGLAPSMRKILFSPQERKLLEDANLLTRTIGPSINQAMKSTTGKVVSEQLGASAPLIAAHYGHLPGLVAAMGGAYGTGKLLASRALRNAYIKSLESQGVDKEKMNRILKSIYASRQLEREP